MLHAFLEMLLIPLYLVALAGVIFIGGRVPCFPISSLGILPSEAIESKPPGDGVP